MHWNVLVYERFDVPKTIRRFYVSTEEQELDCRRSWQAGSLSEVGGEGNCLANRPLHEWQLFTSASNITWACCCLLLAAVSTMCLLMPQSLAGRETEITCCVTLRTRWPLVTKALCARMNYGTSFIFSHVGWLFRPPPHPHNCSRISSENRLQLFCSMSHVAFWNLPPTPGEAIATLTSATEMRRWPNYRAENNCTGKWEAGDWEMMTDGRKWREKEQKVQAPAGMCVDGVHETSWCCRISAVVSDAASEILNYLNFKKEHDRNWRHCQYGDGWG